MREKIKKIFRIIATIIAILWIFSEIALKDSWEEPNITVIVGVLVMWAIIIYSLREQKQLYEKIITERIGFCRNCGEKLLDDASFCNKCGEKVKAS